MPTFRLSLRELFVLVAMTALAIVSLKYADRTWLAVVAAIAMIAFLMALVVAGVDRGRRQAFALGFVLVSGAYGYLLVSPSFDENNRNPEASPYSGRLPTSRLLSLLYRGINSNGYYDNLTGKLVPDYDPNADRALPGRRRLITLPDGRVQQAISYRKVPPDDEFMRIGHCWWALLLGYVGGRFATIVYQRRMGDEQKLPAETS